MYEDANLNFDEQNEINMRRALMKKSRRKETMLALGLMAPFLILFFVFSVIPFMFGFVFSFMRYNPNDPSAAQFVGFQNYAEIFKFGTPLSDMFWDSFGTMFLFDIVAVPLLIIIPFFLAYLINLQPPGYKFFRLIIYLPTVVSISILGIIFGNMFASNSTGLINSWLNTEIKWLSGSPWHGDTLRWLVILIATIWWQTGSNFIIFTSALRNVPKSLYEACEMDGGKRWKRILYVTLPGVKSAVALCLFNTLISYLNLYGQVYVLNDLSNKDILVSPMMFLQFFLMNNAFARQTGLICACAIVFGLIVMVFSVIQRKCLAEHIKKPKYIAEYEIYSDNKKISTSLNRNVGDDNNEVDRGSLS